MRAWIVDAFADERYAGNSAAVIHCADDFPAVARMQALASELGVPTTAFLVSRGGAEYGIRWFTPRAELNLCGHATVASACYLYEVAGAAEARLCFHTRASGALYARREGDALSLDLPLMDTVPCDPPAGLEAALGARVAGCAQAVDDLLAELESDAAVEALRPDFVALAAIECRGHVVTARAERHPADFVSRSFFPGLGVDEDQVCLSAHCKLAPYWGSRLGKDRLAAIQLSPRGGRLWLCVDGARVHVAGPARVRRSVPLPRYSSL